MIFSFQNTLVRRIGRFSMVVATILVRELPKPGSGHEHSVAHVVTTWRCQQARYTISTFTRLSERATSAQYFLVSLGWPKVLEPTCFTPCVASSHPTQIGIERSQMIMQERKIALSWCTRNLISKMDVMLVDSGMI